jgi:cytochrome b561
VLVATVGAHVAATIYHQWILRDDLFWRMSPIGSRARKRAVGTRGAG